MTPSASPRVIGRKPSPRALIYGFAESQELVDSLQAIFPTSQHIEDPDDVRQSEWDLVVSDRDLDRFERHLFGIGVGSQRYGSTVLKREKWADFVDVGFTDTSIATELLVAPALDPRLERLIDRYLIPLAQSQRENPVLVTHTFSQKPSASVTKVGELKIFVFTTEPNILAGAFTTPSGAEIWCLPGGLTDLIPWVEVALSLWHAIDPNRFPTDPSWHENPRWLTWEELGLAKELDALAHERVDVLEQLTARETEIRRRQGKVRAEVEKNERLLLTGYGDDLAGAAQHALESFGFTVSNRDEVNPPNDRREDLWVTSPEDDSDWIALAEVRGYSKGAAQSDLLRLVGRFAKRYAQDQGREPTRLWYIVNHFSGIDPATRPAPLDTNPGEVAAFSEEGGLVVPTTSLFRALQQMSAGNLDRRTARRELMQAVGRWSEGDVGQA